MAETLAVTLTFGAVPADASSAEDEFDAERVKLALQKA
jgi:hypothetical protein